MPDRQRLLSALIALCYVAAIWRREGWPGALALLVPLAIPLGMIWYAGSISRSEGWGWARGRIDRPTPPMAVRLLGWVLLLTPAIIIVAQRLRAS